MNIPIKTEMIPDNVYYALHDAISRGASIREVFAAGLNAWPNGTYDSLNPFGETRYIILPVPQKDWVPEVIK